ncbi:MAG: acyl carrier protein [Saprospiraceae bacterium]|jgi:acyl carrier protein
MLEMMSEKIIEKIISETFEIPVDTVNMNSSKKDVAQWDSIGHIHLMVALEEEFEITINASEFADLNSAQEITVFISKLT